MNVSKNRGKGWKDLRKEAGEHVLECNYHDFIQLEGYRNHPLSEEDKEEKQTKEPYSDKSGARIWEDEPVGDGSIANDEKVVSLCLPELGQGTALV